MVTLEQLRAICPLTKAGRLAVFVEPLNDAMPEFGINTLPREAAFLAQAAHETMGFVHLKEIGSGVRYEGRTDLGNDEPGEGMAMKGHGIFQLTGDKNFQAAGVALHGDRDWYRYNPDLAAEPLEACRIAGWYWQSNGLNELADAQNFRKITIRINGGLNGYDDRVAYWNRAQEVLA